MSKEILYLGNFFAPSGHQGPSVELVQKLKSRGLKFLISSDLRSPFLRTLQMLACILFKSGSYDTAVIEVYSGRAFLWAEACACLLYILGKKIIPVLHGGNLPEFSEKNPERVKNLFSKAVKIVSPSLYLKEMLAGIRPDIRIIPNGAELSRYRFKLRTQISPNFIWIRSFHSVYNPSLAVRVLARIVKDYPNASLSFVGPDKGDGSFTKARALAEELGVQNKIIFHGPAEKSEIPALLEKADIFLNTSNIDNMPVSVIEAMACGLCVLSTDAGGLSYLIENRQDGILVPSGDADKMTEAADFLLKNPEFCKKISERAAQKVKGCDWSAVLAQWEKLLGSV